MHSLKKVQAFSLIELITVIAVIAILASLLFPALNYWRKKGDSVQCVSQLRQIGVGIGLYMGDNNGEFPGPLTSKQASTYNKDTQGSLAQKLEKYYHSNPASPNSQNLPQVQIPNFLCPAAARLVSSPTSPTYMVNMLDFPAYKQPPWGNIALNQQPLTQSALTNLSDALVGDDPLTPSTLWAVKDGDQDYFRDMNFFASDPSGLPQHPAHDTHRNALFYDFHVAPVQYITITTTVVIDPPH